MLTSTEIRMILQLLAEEYGPGYSSVEEIGQLQAKLSILLELALEREKAQ